MAYSKRAEQPEGGVPLEGLDGEEPPATGSSTAAGKAAQCGLKRGGDSGETLADPPQQEKPSSPQPGQSLVLSEEDQRKAPMTDLTRAITPKGIEVIYVGWDGPDDPASPRNWKPMRKWILSIVGFSFCSTVSITVSAYSISVPVIQEELGCSRLLALAGIR